MPINAWFQTTDFNTMELGPYDLSKALELYGNEDWWAEQQQLEEQRQARNEDNCPPGVGFTNTDNDSTLHISQLSPSDNLIFFGTVTTKKTLGLFSSKQRTNLNKQGLSIAEARQIINWFYAGDHDSIARALR